MQPAQRKPIGLFTVFSIGVAVLCTAASYASAEDAKAGTTLVYIGTYTGPKSQGIYVSRLDPATGSLSKPELAAEMINPSWVTLHPNGKFLYAAGESGPYKGGGGAVSAFSIGQDGKLTALNSQEPNGKGPCHLAIDPTGKTILVSNWGDGSMSSLLVGDDGTLAPSEWVDKYPTLGKQKPHAHHSAFDPSNRFAVTCEAGLDRIVVYRFDAATGLLTANDPPFASTIAETHPRHLTFSLDGRFCYNIDEKAMSVTAFRFNAKKGVLRQIQAISTLPADFSGKAGSTAELVLHPSGKFLYGSNRGPDNIVGYSVDQKTGKLSLVGHTSTLGKTCRSFGIDPSGQWMIVGNQNSDTVVQFKINQSTGELTPTGTVFDLGAPVCFQFLEAK